ncbi:uncharacterized protein ZK1073.1-like isoform X2 [Anneissia japonica]|uniref:uncharacterized protein ZK1073.1-like isoform X2 n=1 Tax=Anneissia japonica TaxID=1529436 RepID=UPI0014255E3A|nr:uncharacterized protein ZK1073.1-like isoform X2 [Anneissia japonica]
MSTEHHEIPEPKLEEVWTEKWGAFHCYIQGDKEKQKMVCLTFHDIGLNHSSYVKLISQPVAHGLATKMCFVHINAPGQQDNAEPLKDGYVYPTMQQLADEVPYLLEQLGFQDKHTFVGLGEGAGSNVLLRFAIAHPERVQALVLLECTATSASFTEWGHEKVAAWNMDKGMNPKVENYILWHHLGNHSKDKLDVVQEYHENLYKRINSRNLHLFIDSFINRNNIIDKLDGLKLPMLLVTGSRSPHLKDVDKMWSHVHDKRLSNLLKAEDVAGDIKEEDPRKLIESMTYFLQGLGLISSLPLTRLGHSASLGETSKEHRGLSMSDMDKPTHSTSTEKE